MERRLSAIFAADVASYSALMERDEAGTFDRLRAHRKELFEPSIHGHRGRIFKLMGDGLLAEFGSVVDAVECAAELQRAMARRNEAASQDHRIDVRIGITLGDVIVEGEDRYGEGVNVAARLQQLADPGGIVVSRAAYEQAKNKLDIDFDYLGEQHVKNIAESIPVYRVKLDRVRRRSRLRKPARPWQWATAAIVALVLVAAGLFWGMNEAMRAQAPLGKPALAVLPFANLSGGAGGRRLADGITEDIITDLSRFKDFEVIARNSTEVYKGAPVDVRKVGLDLGVRYVLEGSIQMQTDRVRITGQLIDAASGTHVWSSRWDRPATDLFSIQSEVAEAVAAALGGSSNIGAVTQSEKEKMRRKPPASLSAYELYLIGVEAKSQPTKERVIAGLAALDKAIALDPEFARAYTIRGWLHMFSSDFAGVPWPESVERMGSDMKRGFELDARDPDLRAALGFYFSLVDKLAEADSLIHEALALNPNSVHILALAAATLPYTGHPEEAATLADRALRLDPRMVPVNLGALTQTYFFARRFEDAIRIQTRVPEENRFQAQWLFLAASNAFLDREAEAQEAKAALLARRPDINAQVFFSESWYFARHQEEGLFFEAFRVLRLPMCATPEQLRSIATPKPLPECPAPAN